MAFGAEINGVWRSASMDFKRLARAELWIYESRTSSTFEDKDEGNHGEGGGFKFVSCFDLLPFSHLKLQ